jgi:hypothetical protein
MGFARLAGLTGLLAALLIGSPTQTTGGSARWPLLLRADSVLVQVVNFMPHEMILSVQEKSGKRDLGEIGQDSTRMFVFRGDASDSVVVWATHPMGHQLNRVVKLSERSPVVWEVR